MNCLAVFRSRTHTFSFAELCNERGIFVKIISTPSELNLGCGYSCRFAYSSLSVVKSLLNARNFSSFAGLYRVTQSGIFPIS